MLRRKVASEPFGFPWDLDAPRPGTHVSAHSVFVRGWIAAPSGASVNGPWIENGEWIVLDRERRPDAELIFPADQMIGFRGMVPVRSESASREWWLVVTVDGVERRQSLASVYMPLGLSPGATQAFERAKAAKLERLEPLLRCPALVDGDRCGSRLDPTKTGLTCRRCGRRYSRDGRRINMLSDELLALSGVEDTENISGWDYDPFASQIIDEYRDGLILDNGSGLRRVYYENVVNLEVVDYESTDVLGVGERLPFDDDTFDAVISFAVLEHVRDPFRCAAEISRIVRPEGRIYVATAFLSPYHGYPHHYYNMTLQGLEELFNAEVTIDRAWTPETGRPIFSLAWFLNRYVAGLPANVAETFKEKRVGDLLGTGFDYLGQDFVKELPDAVNNELAAAVHILGTKKS